MQIILQIKTFYFNFCPLIGRWLKNMTTNSSKEVPTKIARFLTKQKMCIHRGGSLSRSHDPSLLFFLYPYQKRGIEKREGMGHGH